MWGGWRGYSVDREGNQYGSDRLGNRTSPARQLKKASGMSGRRWRNHRKAVRRQGFTMKLDKFGETVYNL